jgi:hypothetical protein
MDSRKTSAPTLAALVVLCLLGLLLGLKALTADLPDEPLVETGPASCLEREVTAGEKVFPADVLVNVFNGGSRAGVARSTLDKLVERGFVRGETDNAEGAEDVRFVQIWAEDPGNPAVQLVAKQFGPATKISSGHPSLADGVVVVVGSDFTTLGRKVPSVTAGEDTTICSPQLQ